MALLKQKKRENIPYLFSKLKETNYITGLHKVIGTKHLHSRELNIRLGFPSNKTNLIENLEKHQHDQYIHSLCQYNLIYEGKDKEEVANRYALAGINSYRHWRFIHGLPCRGQRTKTNASTAQNRQRSKVKTPEEMRKMQMKENREYNAKVKKIMANKKK